MNVYESFLRGRESMWFSFSIVDKLEVKDSGSVATSQAHYNSVNPCHLCVARVHASGLHSKDISLRNLLKYQGTW